MTRLPLAIAALCLPILCWLLGGMLLPRHEAVPIVRPLEAANAAFDRGIADESIDANARKAAFTEAAEQYESALRRRRNGAIAYNLGNARVRAGDAPGAIAALQAAQLLSPADPRIAANLAEVRRQVAAPIAPPAPTTLETLRAAWSHLSESLRYFTALGAWSLGLALFVWGMMSPEPQRARAERAGFAIAALGVAFFATLVLDAAAMRHSNLGVLGTSTTLRKGNGLGFEPVFKDPLPAGTEFRLGESRPGWQEVRLPDGTTGWIDETAVEPGV
jgi:tetratricopeptide (TPR) repeat protein